MRIAIDSGFEAVQFDIWPASPGQQRCGGASFPALSSGIISGESAFKDSPDPVGDRFHAKGFLDESHASLVE